MKVCHSRAAGLIAVSGLFFALLGCGYHASGGKAVRLPSDLHTVAVPIFKNNTNFYGVEQVLTQAVVREFLERTQYRVITGEDSTADAVLRGTVTGVSISPLTAQGGRINSAMVAVSMRIALLDRKGKPLYDNTDYSFREQYQISCQPQQDGSCRAGSNFLQEEGPAVDRLGREFARALVSNVLEAF